MQTHCCHIDKMVHWYIITAQNMNVEMWLICQHTVSRCQTRLTDVLFHNQTACWNLNCVTLNCNCLNWKMFSTFSSLQNKVNMSKNKPKIYNKESKHIWPFKSCSNQNTEKMLSFIFGTEELYVMLIFTYLMTLTSCGVKGSNKSQFT